MIVATPEEEAQVFDRFLVIHPLTREDITRQRRRSALALVAVAFGVAANVLATLAEATNIIAEGEVLQLSVAKNMATTEDEYLAVIRAKTAALFSAAAEVGPVIAGRAPQAVGVADQQAHPRVAHGRDGAGPAGLPDRGGASAPGWVGSCGGRGCPATAGDAATVVPVFEGYCESGVVTGTGPF